MLLSEVALGEVYELRKAKVTILIFVAFVPLIIIRRHNVKIHIHICTQVLTFFILSFSSRVNSRVF